MMALASAESLGLALIARSRLAPTHAMVQMATASWESAFAAPVLRAMTVRAESALTIAPETVRALTGVATATLVGVALPARSRPACLTIALDMGLVRTMDRVAAMMGTTELFVR